MKCKIIIFANKVYSSKVNKIISELHGLGIENYSIICLDDFTLNELNTDNKIYCPLRFDNTWEGKKVLWVKRIQILSDILHNEDFDILHSDADTTWLKNPLSLFKDTEVNSYFTAGLNYPDFVFNKWGFVVRGGFYYLRNNDFNKYFMKELVKYTEKYLDDQIALNRLLLHMGTKWEQPIEPKYVRQYMHSNNNFYDIMYNQKPINGYVDKHKIQLLSSYDFPRLDTNTECYISDLYCNKKYVISD